jgi:hypothetical protein|tara:strand:+ start:269 stop:604 length:336 start_codon:yes stop_codon:yes gene_type:complete
MHDDIMEAVLLQTIIHNVFTLEGHPAIAVHQWGRDCDQFESDQVFILKAELHGMQGLILDWPTNLLEQFSKREAAMEENREGPCTMVIISKEDWKEFIPTTRDHRAEQYNY